MGSSESILISAMQYAPDFLLKRFSSVLLGIVVGYSLCLLFMGPLSFFYGALQLLITGTVAWALSVFVRMAIQRGSNAAEWCLNSELTRKRCAETDVKDDEEDLD